MQLLLHTSPPASHSGNVAPDGGLLVVCEPDMFQVQEKPWYGFDPIAPRPSFESRSRIGFDPLAPTSPPTLIK
ncbi:MAG: hypothetical protein WBQ25_17205 [Nitrososphaeraceae archaeon]